MNGNYERSVRFPSAHGASVADGEWIGSDGPGGWLFEDVVGRPVVSADASLEVRVAEPGVLAGVTGELDYESGPLLWERRGGGPGEGRGLFSRWAAHSEDQGLSSPGQLRGRGN
jgi:hypothetical protein